MKGDYVLAAIKRLWLREPRRYENWEIAAEAECSPSTADHYLWIAEGNGLVDCLSPEVRDGNFGWSLSKKYLRLWVLELHSRGGFELPLLTSDERTSQPR